MHEVRSWLNQLVGQNRVSRRDCNFEGPGLDLHPSSNILQTLYFKSEEDLTVRGLTVPFHYHGAIAVLTPLISYRGKGTLLLIVEYPPPPSLQRGIASKYKRCLDS